MGSDPLKPPFQGKIAPSPVIVWGSGGSLVIYANVMSHLYQLLATLSSSVQLGVVMD